MLLKDLLCGVEFRTAENVGSITVSGISTDSGSVSPGDVFVCIKGTHTDGHMFSEVAEKRGAVAIVAERRVSSGVPQVIVDNTRSAAAKMWSRYYGDPAGDMTVIAVTGTNGKTSVSYMIRHVLMSAGINVGMIGTVMCTAGDEVLSHGGGSEIGAAASAMTTPDPKILYGLLRQMKDRGVTHVVMEASSHALAQHKLDPITPDVAVFTGLSPEHLDFHGSMDEYLRAKATLFYNAQKRVINADDYYAAKLCKMVGGDFVRVGADSEMLDFTAENVARCTGEVMYDLRLRCGDTFIVRSPMSGRFGLYNSALAIGAASAIGIDVEEACNAIGSFKGVPGRMETIARCGGLTVIRDYAHTPDAMRSALEILREEKCGRLWLVFGCGGDRDRTKRPTMGQIASELADFTVVTSDNCRSEQRDAIIEDIMKGFDKTKPHKVIPDREEAVRYAVRYARDGDTVLLCGKGHENYEITREGMRPFDEVLIAQSELMKRKPACEDE